MFEYNATVYNVVDGDTIDVEIDLGFKIFTKQRIRMTGIDTPERGQDRYVEAGDFLRNLIQTKKVVLKTTKASKWGYMLGNVYLASEHINQRMITEGWAKAYDGGTKEVYPKQ